MANWIKGAIVNNRNWTEQLHSLYVKAPVASFQAGQFTKLALDIDGTRIGRPYSFVNAPTDETLEFYYITVPGGQLTPQLTKLKTGDHIWLTEAPAGFFTLDEVPDGKHLWLLSSGTALGVFLSILKTEIPWQRFEKIILVHAVRHSNELTHQEDIHQFQNAHPQQFNMVAFVSQQEATGTLHGRIPEAIIDGRLEKTAGITLNAAQSQVMICGNPDMVRDTTETLIQRGLKKNRRRDPGQITVEHYA